MKTCTIVAFGNCDQTNMSIKQSFISTFLKENVSISIKISLKFVPKVPMNNIPASVQIMAWHRPGDKSLSEPMMVNLLINMQGWI